MIFVLFADGKSGWFVRYNIEGAAMIGEPTVYVYRQVGFRTTRVYVKPGTSVDWIETSNPHALLHNDKGI